MATPNVLFLVWDSCRLDAAKEHAPNLNDLAEENIWFDRAVTASGWSHPSHMSLFSGEYPHEHGCTSLSDMFDSVPLVTDLGRDGYTTYGLTSNQFASTSYGFGTHFDTFYHTRNEMVYPKAFDLRRYISEHRKEARTDVDIDPVDLAKAMLRQGDVAKSLVNATMEGLSYLTSQYPQLERLPSRRFAQQNTYTYNSARETELITEILEAEATGGAPFFLFSNNMDPHWPYNPPNHHQRRYFDRPRSYRELLEINRHAKATAYLERVSQGDHLDEDVLETIRRLYYGEVRSADEQLGDLLQALKRHGLYDDTLIVVVADHGENMAETDEMGENTMGHESSASDVLHRVPLLVAHPDLEPATVDEWVSTKNVARLFTRIARRGLPDREGVVETLRPSSGVAFSEFPASGRGELVRDRYPGIDFDRLTRDLIVGYTGEWKAIATSTDGVRCWHDGVEADVSEAPTELVDGCHARLGAFADEGERSELSDSAEAQLKNLGYL